MDHNYSFAYFTKGNEDVADEYAIEDNLMRNIKYDANITWDCVLRDFIGFLSAIYGYDISDKVKFQTLEDKLNKIREENDYSSDWPFDDEEEVNDKGEETSQV
jgi:hypothetical protein